MVDSSARIQIKLIPRHSQPGDLLLRVDLIERCDLQLPAALASSAAYVFNRDIYELRIAEGGERGRLRFLVCADQLLRLLIIAEFEIAAVRAAVYCPESHLGGGG